jgi:predicted nucleic acid-binding protein
LGWKTPGIIPGGAVDCKDSLSLVGGKAGMAKAVEDVDGSRADSIPFGSAEAIAASQLYGAKARPRGREIDIAIAAVAISRDAELWTLNLRDYAGIPGLRLFST